MRHGAVLGAIAFVLGAAQALAAEPTRPVEIHRHGEAVTHLRNLERIALFGTAEPGAVREALSRHAMVLDDFGRAADVTVLAVRREDGAVPAGSDLDAAAQELLAVPGVTGHGPVYFEGDAMAVPTGRIWVYLPAGAGESAARARLKTMGLALEEYIEATRGVAIARPSIRFSMTEAVSRLRAGGHDVEPELMRKYSPRSIPTDSYFQHQWYLRNTGSNVMSAYGSTPVPATAFADCRASDAWDLSTGSSDVIVGVIDSGTDCTHPELEGKCVAPYNAITNQNDATPPTLAEDMMAGHGTSVAGIVAAPIDSVGMVGVCPDCRIAPVRLIQSGTFLTDAMMLRAFKHAVDAGAAVINNSWGPAASGEYMVPVSAGEFEGLQYAGTGRGGLGTLVVYAAGNESSDTQYLGQLKTGLGHVMAIAATNQLDLRSDYSNFGQQIDLAAPSNDMYLTPSYISLEVMGRGDLDDDYTNSFGGTSAAAPVVSGVAALVFSVNANATAEQVRDLLRGSADKIDPDGGFYDAQGHSVKYGYGRVNAFKALLAATGATNPSCNPPAATEDCGAHLDENCDGFVDEGCSSTSTAGTPCAAAAECGTEPLWLCPTAGKVRGVCTWDCSISPCPSGYACVQGRCAPECNDDTPCAFPTETVCTDDVLGVCLLRCTSSADCGANELCDPQTQICRLDTDGLPGSRCTADECVGDAAMCLTPAMGFPDGYCTHGCMSNLHCENGGKCIQTSMGDFCYVACSFDGDCRSGYVCEQAGPRAGTCYKRCDKDSQCRGTEPGWDNIVCDLSNGRCIDQSAPDGGTDAAPDGEPDTGPDGALDGGADVDMPDSAGNDAAVNPEGGAPAAPATVESDDDGCGCRVVRGEQPSRAPWMVLSVLGVVLALRRRAQRG